MTIAADLTAAATRRGLPARMTELLARRGVTNGDRPGCLVRRSARRAARPAAPARCRPPARSPAARPRPRRARHGLRRLRRRRSRRPRDPDPGPAPLRAGAWSRTCRAVSTRATACPSAAIEAAERSGARVIVTVDCGTSSGPEIALAATRGIDVIVTDHHRVPPELPPALAVVNPHRADSTYPDDRLAGSGVAFKVAQLLLADEPGGPAFALGLADLADDRDGRRRGAHRRREPGHRPPGPGATAARPAPRHRRPPGACPRGARGRRPRHHRVRPRAAAQRGRPGRRGARGGPPAPRGGRGRGRGPRRRPGGRQPDPARPHDERHRRGPGGRRSRSGSSRHHRPRAVGRRDRRAGRIAAGRGPQPAGHRRSGPRRHHPGLVPERRLGGPRGGPGGSAPTCSRGTAVTPARPGSSCRPSAGTPSSSGSRRSPGPRSRPTRAPPCASTSRSLPWPSTTACIASWPSLAPYGPGNPEPLVAVLGLTVTRVRVAGADHTSLTLRRDRDVLDGIAFGRADIADARRGGRPDRRRRARHEPAVRRVRVAPAGDPRRRAQWRPSGGGRRPRGLWRRDLARREPGPGRGRRCGP